MAAKRVPDIDLMLRENGKDVPISTTDLFARKRVVIFGVPGAFTPNCTSQLPAFEAKCDEIKAQGIAEVYCISMNDAFVMNAWGESLNITKVKLLPDGNGEFTNGMGMIAPKFNRGFAIRSWRYVAVIDDGNVVWMTEEPGRGPNCEDDTYSETTPEKVLEYLRS